MPNQGPLAHMNTFGTSWGLMPSDNAVVFVDNYDTQRGGQGMEGKVITYKSHRVSFFALLFKLPPKA